MWSNSTPYVLCLLLGFWTTIATCQEAQTEWKFGAAPFTGFIIPHHPEMEYLQNDRLVGVELSGSLRSDGRKDWHHWYNFPEWGFIVDVYDFGSPYLGKGATGKIFIDLPIDKKRLFFLKLSFGAGYVENIFDPEENVHNSAIGSKLNAALGVEGHFRIEAGKHLEIHPGIALYHLSNGAFQMPNSGINMPVLKLGLAYRPYGGNPPQREEREFSRKSSRLNLGASFGAKEIKPIGGSKYLAGNVFADWVFRVSPKSSFGVEGGLNYNESLRHRLADIHEPPGERAYNYRPYIAALYQLHFDPLVIRLAVGNYISPKFTGDGTVFMRYHLVYEWRDWQVFCGLKSHYAKADHMEIGLSRRILSFKSSTQ